MVPQPWSLLIESRLHLSFLLFVSLFHFSTDLLFHFSIVIPRYCFIFQSLTLLFHFPITHIIVSFSNRSCYCFIFQTPLIVKRKDGTPSWDWNHQTPYLIHDALDHRTTVSCSHRRTLLKKTLIIMITFYSSLFNPFLSCGHLYFYSIYNCYNL